MGADRLKKGTCAVSILAADLDRLGAVTRLLHRAALEVWQDADQGDLHSPLHSLGLGVFLAEGRAAELMPTDYELPADEQLDGELEGQSPLRLLVAAEELSRFLPLTPELSGLSHLVVDLCDLIREARDVGY